MAPMSHVVRASTHQGKGANNPVLAIGEPPPPLHLPRSRSRSRPPRGQTMKKPASVKTSQAFQPLPPEEQMVVRDQKFGAKLAVAMANCDLDKNNKTFLEGESVSDKKQNQYDVMVQPFVQWIGPENWAKRDLRWIDAELVVYMDVLFKQGKSLSQCSHLLAGVKFSRSDVARLADLVRCCRGLRGWQKLEPLQGRLGFPFMMAAAIANRLVSKSMWRHALRTMVSFALYPRPKDIDHVRWQELVAPGSVSKSWVVILNVSERAVRSKTGASDESLMIDTPRFASWLGRALVQDRKPEEKDTDPIFGQADYGKQFSLVCKELGFIELGISCQYQLRHGGASTESVEGTRSSVDIMRRLRVTATKTFKRYENGGRLSEVAARLPESMLNHCEECESKISNILLSKCQPVHCAWGV